MKHLLKTTRLKNGDVIVSVAFQFSKEELQGAHDISDQPQNTSLRGLRELSKEPLVLLSFLREFIYFVGIFNSDSRPVIDAMTDRKKLKRKTKKRRQRK